MADLEDEITALKAKDIDLQNQINVIDGRLRWMAVDGSEENQG